MIKEHTIFWRMRPKLDLIEIYLKPVTGFLRLKNRNSCRQARQKIVICFVPDIIRIEVKLILKNAETLCVLFDDFWQVHCHVITELRYRILSPKIFWCLFLVIIIYNNQFSYFHHHVTIHVLHSIYCFVAVFLFFSTQHNILEADPCCGIAEWYSTVWI